MSRNDPKKGADPPSAAPAKVAENTPFLAIFQPATYAESHQNGLRMAYLGGDTESPQIPLFHPSYPSQTP